MEFQELRVFIEVIDQGGFQKASRVLHLTQSAVSQSLANLERKLGEKLVERSSPVRPTPIGYELLNHARFIIGREKEFIHDLQRLKHGHLQKLSLAVDHLVNEYLCAESIVAVLKRLPELSFRIKRLPAREMIQAVQSGQFELGFGPFQKNMNGLTAVRLFEETSYLVTSKKNMHFKTYRQDPMGFLSETILLASYLDEPSLRPSKVKIRDYFKGAWEVDNISLQIKILESGTGVTYMPKSILDRDMIAKDFVILNKIPFHKVAKFYGIYHRAEEELSPAASTFIEEAVRL